MLSKEQVRKLLSYNKNTGVLTWIDKPHPRANDSIVGKRAGTRHHSGARQVCIRGKIYLEHSIIWLLVYGYIPKEIDHINLISDDNRLINLRECTHSQNNANKRVQKNNKLKIKGVYRKSDGKYLMSIKCKDIVIRKTFNDVREAQLAYQYYSCKLFGSFARTT